MKQSRFRLKKLRFGMLAALTAIVTILIGVSGFFLWQHGQPIASVNPQPVNQITVASTPTPSQSSPVLSVWSQIPKAPPSSAPAKPTPPVTLTPSPYANLPNGTNQFPQDDLPEQSFSSKQAYLSPGHVKYGHLSYAEAPGGRLVPIGPPYYERTESLIDTAAAAFGRMQADAAKTGIKLIPISGFRSVADQVKLFERQVQRRGNEENAARLSAPPGYSEHHTGYSLDIGDGNQTKTDLKYEFENTDAYQWLRTHATQTYGFELSFPENNKQGVSFEPWHWRHTGSQEAAQIFSVAHRMF
jgi:zinc D-Ala-D-Ala carboxypeptidase